MLLTTAYPKMLFGVWLLVLVACTSNERLLVLSGMDLIGQASLAELQIESGEVLVAINSVALEDSEQEKVRYAENQYENSRLVLASITGDPITLMNAISALKMEHTRLDTAYRLLQEVVANNWESYSAINQLRLATWQQEVFRLEIAYQQFIAQIDSRNAQEVKNAAVIDLLTTLTKLALVVA